MAIKVGDKVRWSSADRDDIYEVVLAVTSAHAFVVWLDGGGVVRRAPLSELTLVESAPSPLSGLQAENARLREALQMAVDTIAHNGPDGVSMAAALGIRPSIRHKETR